MGVQNEIIVRKIKNEDFDGLVSLYEDVWPNENYDKRAKANFVLNESRGINICAEYNNKIVGSRTSFFINAYYGDKPLNCVQIGDSCVSSECRGKGLFQRMNKQFLREFFPDGDLIYNISVLQSKISYEKLGWIYIKSLTSIFKIVNPIKTLFKIRFNIKKLTGTRIWDNSQTKINIKEALLNIREKQLRELNLIHINYDVTTFNWRQGTHSGIKCFENEYGCVIYKIGSIKKSNLVIADIGEIFLYEYDRKHFNKILKDFIKCVKPEILQTSICYKHPLYKYYKRSIFIDNPRHKFLYHGVRVNTDEMRNIALNADNWGICTLDIDTF